MAATVTIDLVADAAKAEQAMRDVGDGADRMANDIESASRTASRAAGALDDSIGGAADNVASASSQAAGGIGDLGGALSLMPGPLGALGTGMEAAAPAIMGVTGAADLANLATERLKATTLAQTIASKAQTAATKAQTIATKALNVVMRLNPIGLIITAIIALVALFVVLYKRNEKFRKIVKAVGEWGKKAIGWIVDKVKDLVGWVKDKAPAAWSKMKSIAVKAFNAIPVVWLTKRLIDVVKWVKDKLPDAWQRMKTAAKKALDFLTAPLRAFRDILSKIVGWIKDIDFPSPPGWLTDILDKGGDLLGKLSGRSTSAQTTNTTPRPRRGPRTGPPANGNVTINVTGAVDPASTARQIRRILDDDERRGGQ